MGLSFRKTRSGKSHDQCDAMVFEKLRFQNVFRQHEYAKPVFLNSSALKSVLEKFLSFDGLVWMVGLAEGMKLRFQITPAC